MSKLREKLAAKIDKSKKIIESVQQSKTNSVDQVQAFRIEMLDMIRNLNKEKFTREINHFSNTVTSLINTLEDKNIKKLEAITQKNPGSLTEEQHRSLKVYDECREKLKTVSNSLTPMQNRIAALEKKYPWGVLESRIFEGISILNKITQNIEALYQEKKANKKRDNASKENYITSREDKIKNLYEDYFNRILEIDVAGLQKQKRDSQSSVNTAKKSNTVIAVFKYIDDNFANLAGVMKSKLKGVIELLDTSPEPKNYWDSTENIEKFLRFITTDNFKSHYKSVVGKKAEFLQQLSDAATKESDQKKPSEIQSKAAEVVREYGFGKNVNSVAILRLVDEAFKGNSGLQLRNDIVVQLNNRSEKQSPEVSVVTQPQPAVKVAEAPVDVIVAPVVEVAEAPVVVIVAPAPVDKPTESPPKETPVASAPPLQNRFTLFAATKKTETTVDTASIISRLVEKLQSKLKELEGMQWLPSTAPQLRKHNSTHIASLQNIIQNINNNHTDLVTLRDIILKEVQEKRFVNVVTRNMLEAFVKQIEKALPNTQSNQRLSR